jgi:nicotinamidase-related amidase
MADIYAERGYGAREVGFGRKPGLVVVDFQTGFTDPAAPMGGSEMVDAACARTGDLVRHAKRAGVPVVACVIAFDSPAAVPHWKVGPVHGLIAGFRVQVVEDCVGDHDLAAHRQNLADVGRRYADVIDAAAAMAAIETFARRNDRA